MDQACLDQALTNAGLAYQRPYDLRHSFASLLLHEGRSVIYVARQLGHSAALTMKIYGHVIEELDEAPRASPPRRPSWPRAVAEMFGECSRAASDACEPTRTLRKALASAGF